MKNFKLTGPKTSVDIVIEDDEMIWWKVMKIADYEQERKQRTCDCKCHTERNIPNNCWCPDCMDNHVSLENDIMMNMEKCERCGDLIGLGDNGMEKHLEWCMVPGKDIHGI